MSVLLSKAPCQQSRSEFAVVPSACSRAEEYIDGLAFHSFTCDGLNVAQKACVNVLEASLKLPAFPSAPRCRARALPRCEARGPCEAASSAFGAGQSSRDGACCQPAAAMAGQRHAARRGHSSQAGAWARCSDLPLQVSPGQQEQRGPHVSQVDLGRSGDVSLYRGLSGWSVPRGSWRMDSVTPPGSHVEPKQTSAV